MPTSRLNVSSWLTSFRSVSFFVEQQFLKVRDRSIVFIPKLYLPYSRLQINFLTAWRNSTIIFCPKMYKHPSFKFSNEFKVSMFISYRKFPINPFDPRSKNFWSTFLKTSCIYYCPEKEENQSLFSPSLSNLLRERKNTRFHWIGTAIELWVNEPLIRRLIREIGSLIKLAVSALTWSVHTRHLSRCLVRLGVKASLIGRDIKAVSSPRSTTRSVTWSFGGSRNKMADANEAWVSR